MDSHLGFLKAEKKTLFNGSKIEEVIYLKIVSFQLVKKPKIAQKS